MQLYNAAHSPYAARCRIQIAHKALPVAILPPPGGLGSAELKSKNPTGRIPVLDLGDSALGESWAIMEYLEARFPQPPMLPAEALDLARLRELVRFCDLYLAPAMFPLFRALRGAEVDHAAALDALRVQLGLLDALLARRRTHLPLDLADAALMPVVWYAQRLARHHGDEALPPTLAAVNDWWQRCRAVPAVTQVLYEMEQGLRAAVPALFPAAASA